MKHEPTRSLLLPSSAGTRRPLLALVEATAMGLLGRRPSPVTAGQCRHSLNPQQASQIPPRLRQHLAPGLYGACGCSSNPLRPVHLVGKKLPSNSVGMVTPAQPIRYGSSSRSTWSTVSFRRQVSPVNSVVSLRRHGRIRRFNRSPEELTGVKEEDIVGRNFWALFMSTDSAAASSQKLTVSSIAARVAT